MRNDPNKAMAEFFYEQCAGSTSGHMAMLPNNPVVYGLIKAHTGTRDNCHAATKTDFAVLLRKMADELTDGPTPQSDKE